MRSAVLTTLQRTSLALAATGIAVGCGGEELNRCSGDRPTDLGACFRGDFFAECGGEGEPKLACHDTAGCSWFTTDCAPDGFRASDCPLDDICCHSGWPFSDTDDNGTIYYLNGKIAGLGQSPWNRSREVVLSVTADSSLSGATAVTCTGTIETGYTPCDDAYLDVDVLERDTLVIRTSTHRPIPPRGGWGAWIEIVPDAVTGEASARFCKYGFTDLATALCQRQEATCATSGAITINQWPANGSGLVVAFDVAFENGATATGVLAQ